MLVNFTNHPSSQWGERQLREAEKYGDIVDVPFPAVDPEEDEAYIGVLASQAGQLTFPSSRFPQLRQNTASSGLTAEDFLHSMFSYSFMG